MGQAAYERARAEFNKKRASLSGWSYAGHSPDPGRAFKPQRTAERLSDNLMIEWRVTRL
jgi:hypothetical protein